MAGVVGWFGEQRRIYCDNAAMVREFRTQLRGNKAPLSLTAYLGILVFMAVIVYWGISFGGDRSVTSMQGSLTNFYYVVVGMLEFLVAIIAPVVASSSIIGEYERKSIDLVFSSPMGAKYFLVGKLISSYRYVLMLIVLAMPIAALAVVLGGATWADVVSALWTVSMHGLLYMAVSLPIAVMTAKSISAVLLSYVANFVWVNLAFGFGAPSLSSGTFSSPLIGLAPYLTGVSSNVQVDFFGLHMPMWVSTTLFAFLFVKLFVVGAGSALTQGGSKETVSLRVHGLLYTLAFGLILGFASSSGATIPFGVTGPDWVATLWVASGFLLVCLPALSTWSLGGGSKNRPNGIFNARQVLRGSPASGLPYFSALLIVLAGSIGFSKFSLDAPMLVYLWAVFAAWGLAWSLGWLSSAFTFRQGPEASKRLLLLLLFVVGVLPGIFLGIVEMTCKQAGMNLPDGWSENFYLFSFISDDVGEASIKASVMTILALVLAFWAEKRRRQIVEDMRSLA